MPLQVLSQGRSLFENKFKLKTINSYYFDVVPIFRTLVPSLDNNFRY